MTKLMTVVAAVLALAGCAAAGKASGSRSGIKSADLYPLAVGNTWRYRASMLGENRDVTVTIVSAERGTYTDSTGAKLMADAYGVRDDKRYLVREPIEVGTVWNNVVSVSSMETYRIIEAGNRCQVPAGQFEQCVVVEGRNKIEGNKSLVNEMTFAPRVGLVRIAVSLDNDGQRVPQTMLELTQYELQAAPTPKP